MDFIDMKGYVEELIGYMLDCLDMEGKHIVVSSDVDFRYLHLSKAIPVGLIINEAVTNSVKHGFTGRSDGRIAIRFTCEEALCELTISDNGRGFPAGYDPHTGRSLGMTLLQGFSEQLEGSLSISNSNGASLKVIFKNKV